MLVLELIGLCTVLFIACLLTTGTDEKNLKHYTSYPNEVQTRIQELNFIEVRINLSLIHI